MSAVQMPLIPAVSGDAELVRLFAAVVDRVGLKSAAFDLDVSASQLAHCCAARGSNHVRAEWLSWAVRQPGGEDILRHLAGQAGYDLVAAKPLDPAAELAALKDALAEELGPGMRAALLSKARQKAGAR